MTFVSIDPGPHTGISIWEDTRLVRAVVPSKYSGTGGIIYFLTREINNVDFVICEDFIGQAYTKDEKGTIEIIGFIKGWCSYQDIPLKMQTPAVRKGYLEFAKTFPSLREIDTEVRKHSIDSVAHALRYLHKEVKLWHPQL